MKRKVMKRKMLSIIALIIVLLLAYRVYYLLTRYNHRWWFNYFDQSGIYEIEIGRLDKESQIPKDIIEYTFGDGRIAYIYLYDEWYDVAFYYAEEGAKNFAYRVLTSEIYKLGPKEIKVGTSRLKVDLLFLGTRHSQDLLEILYVNGEGVIETLKCWGYMNTSPVDNSEVGFVFSEGDVVAMVLSPSDI